MFYEVDDALQSNDGDLVPQVDQRWAHGCGLLRSPRMRWIALGTGKKYEYEVSVKMSVVDPEEGFVFAPRESSLYRRSSENSLRPTKTRGPFASIGQAHLAAGVIAGAAAALGVVALKAAR